MPKKSKSSSKTCSSCGATASLSWKYVGGDWFCRHCAPNLPRRVILDATGKRRDRNWLRDKLEMTRNEQKWHDDIKARRKLSDGTVGRFKQSKDGSWKRYK